MSEIADGVQVRVVDHPEHVLPTGAHGKDGQIGVVVGGVLGRKTRRVRIEQNRGGLAGYVWYLHEDQLEVVE